MRFPSASNAGRYAGAAADRWFVKGTEGDLKQPWYQSLAMGSFPIQRGGGTRALD